jgi:hypothetical protein
MIISYLFQNLSYYLEVVEFEVKIVVRPYSHETFGRTILQYKDIAIKNIFEPWISKGQGKLFTKKLIKVNKKKTIHGVLFRAYLGWSLKHGAQNYLFIAVLCAKMSRVNKA